MGTSTNRMLLNNKKEHMDIHRDTEKYWDVEKKPDTKECMLYYSIYLKL